MPGGGGLMQLVAYGAQNVYITGQPSVSFFPVTYRQHTNFAIDIPESNNEDIIHLPIRVEPMIIHAILAADNSTCVVSLEPIAEGGEYWQCGTCHKVIDWEVATVWISEHKNCPHCRQTAGLDTKYVNSEHQP
jgi:hypothetical protein